ncbi:MAG: glutamine--tRNA ligase/YqeY domain fusion protein [Planctomycetota bacterium]|jgi:glutaminyl-tRNA synthetase|nr:glutamine--tRNA ligase/YqeY domain fusion protein [Planctomycetota bacterium]
MTARPPASVPVDFIREFINADLAAGRYDRVQTRFPPEPNGYLHIGHCKAALTNFELARSYGGGMNLRFDDTNPVREDAEYVDAIQADLRWLGIDWGERIFFASDYFDKLYEFAELLIREGKAYVDSQSAETIRVKRGTAGAKERGLTPPGENSPYRGRSAEENLELFRRMRAGEFPDGAHVLRAKIDMAHPNLNMRDPVLYRICRANHIRTGDKWCIYPMYDYAHPISDALEGITHSCCSLEFENHRPLYDWCIANLPVFPSRQIEFARLNLTRTVLSKRWLIQLVKEKRVSGWDDPRMPTISGMRRRGYPPAAIRDFCRRIGLAKTNSRVDVQLLEHCVREDLNRRAPRAMAVINPLRLVIENYPEGGVEWLEAVNNPEDPAAGRRRLPFSRELYIEREDFLEDPPKKFFRLAPGREVRLRYAYLVTCREVVKDRDGGVAELRCLYDPATRGGDAPDGRRVKATLHWVSAAHAIRGEVRLFDHMFPVPDPSEPPPGGTWLDNFNPESRKIVPDCRLEPMLGEAGAGSVFQFERLGYFAADPDGRPGRPVFNRTATLKDSYAKASAPQSANPRKSRSPLALEPASGAEGEFTSPEAETGLTGGAPRQAPIKDSGLPE